MQILCKFASFNKPFRFKSLASHKVEHYFKPHGLQLWADFIDSIWQNWRRPMLNLGGHHPSLSQPIGQPLHVLSMKMANGVLVTTIMHAMLPRSPIVIRFRSLWYFSSASLFENIIFSKFDTLRNCPQLPAHPSDMPRNMEITLFGLFEFVLMSFGHLNHFKHFCSKGMTFYEDWLWSFLTLIKRWPFPLTIDHLTVDHILSIYDIPLYTFSQQQFIILKHLADNRKWTISADHEPLTFISLSSSICKISCIPWPENSSIRIDLPLQIWDLVIGHLYRH